jgi:hypothetical protein
MKPHSSPSVLRRGRPPTLASSRGLRRTSGAAAITIVAVLTGLGALAAGVGRPGEEPGTRQSDPSTQAITRGALTIAVPPGWSSTDEAPRLPEIPFSRPILLVNAASNVRVAADVVPATSETLLPTGFVAGIGAGLPSPERIAMGRDLRGYHYAGLSGPGVGPLVDIYAAPTTEGVATVVCLGDAVTSLLDECWSVVSRMSLSRGRPLPLGSAAAFRQVLLTRLSDLDAAEAVARRRLSDAATTTEQAEAVSPLPSEYRDAAAALAPLVPGAPTWPREVVGALEASAVAYAGFVRALQGALPHAYAEARALLRARRARLKAILDDGLRSGA